MKKHMVEFLRLWHKNRKENPFKTGDEITELTLNRK